MLFGSFRSTRAGDEVGGWPGSFDDVLSGINSANTAPLSQLILLANTVVVGHSCRVGI